MQALEGDIDTVHFGFLHPATSGPTTRSAGSCDYYAVKAAPRRHRDVIEHEIGTTYGAYRPAEETTDYWRIGHFLLPFYTQNATGVLGLRASMRAWVPIDDEHTMVWGIGTAQLADRDAAGIGGLRQSGGRNDPLGRFGADGRTRYAAVLARHDRLARPLPSDGKHEQRLPDRPRAAVGGGHGPFAAADGDLHRRARTARRTRWRRRRWVRSTTARRSTSARPTR